MTSRVSRFRAAVAAAAAIAAHRSIDCLQAVAAANKTQIVLTPRRALLPLANRCRRRRSSVDRCLHLLDRSI